MADQAEETEQNGIDIKTSIEKAKAQQCVWHPWRKAYALCSYCKRPFCYQDLVEHNKSYYCLEDIDIVFPEHEKMQRTAEHNWSTIAGVLLMITFAAFVVLFVLYGTTVQSVSKLTNDFPSSLLHANRSAAISLLEVILIALTFVVALMVLLGAKGAFYIGMIATIGILALFSYLIFTTLSINVVIIDTLDFLSFVTLIQARIIGINATHRLKSKAKSELSDFKETGKF